MKILKRYPGEIPLKYDYYYPNEDWDRFSETLDDSHLDNLPENCVIYYWYVSPPYSGDGWAIVQVFEKYYLVSLSHCSCYGPFDTMMNDFQLENCPCYLDLDDILKDNKNIEKEISFLIDWIKRNE